MSLCTSPDLTALNGIDSVYIMIQGAVEVPTAFTMLTLAPKYISAPEVALYSLLTTVLGPVWVYLGGYESPSSFALYGGIALVIALAINR